MIADLALRWVVTLLFVLSAAECVYLVVFTRAPQPGRAMWLTGQVLHFIMAVAMAVMAWPQGAALPTVAPMLFFLLAAGWFIAAAIIDPDHWAANFYHSAMMLAMSWMYAAMNGRILPGQSLAGRPAGHHGASDMTGMTMPGMADGPAVVPPYIGAVNWLWTAGFAAAALWWLYRSAVAGRSDRTAAVGALGQAMMAAGMAIMFAVML